MIRFITLGATLLSASIPQTETRELRNTPQDNDEFEIRKRNANPPLNILTNAFSSSTLQNIIRGKLRYDQIQDLVYIENKNWLPKDVRLREMTEYLLNAARRGDPQMNSNERHFLENINSIATAKVSIRMLEALKNKALSEGNLDAFKELDNQHFQLKQLINNFKNSPENYQNIGDISEEINRLFKNKDFISNLNNFAKNWDGNINNINPEQLDVLLKTSGLWKHLFEMSTMNRMMLGIIAGITGMVSGVFIFLVRRMRKFGSSKSIKVFAISLTSIFSITTVALGLMAALGGV